MKRNPKTFDLGFESRVPNLRNQDPGLEIKDMESSIEDPEPINQTQDLNL